MALDDPVILSETIREKLSDLRDETGVGPYALLKGQRAQMPQGLNGFMIASWIEGTRKTARRDQLDFVIALWEEHARSGTPRVSLTADHLREMRAHRERTGIEPKALFKAPFTPPEGLSVQMLQNWLQGTVKTVRKDHLDYVLGTWRELPDVARPNAERLGVTRYEMKRGRVVLCEGILNRLRTLRDRSGCSGTALLNEARKMGSAIPSGLTVAEIARWLSGQAKTAEPRHLTFVLEAFDALNRSGGKAFADTAAHSGAVKACSRSVIETPARRVEISPETIRRLETARERSGVWQAELLKSAPDAPHGLTANMISAWINGASATARKDHLDWVLERWEQIAHGG